MEITRSIAFNTGFKDYATNTNNFDLFNKSESIFYEYGRFVACWCKANNLPLNITLYAKEDIFFILQEVLK